MSVVVNIFAIFGLIIIIAILIHYLYKYINNKKKEAISASLNPPGEYMQNHFLVMILWRPADYRISIKSCR